VCVCGGGGGGAKFKSESKFELLVNPKNQDLKKIIYSKGPKM